MNHQELIASNTLIQTSLLPDFAIPTPKVPIPPVRSFAQWGYYCLISLALLFVTIQKATGKSGDVTANPRHHLSSNNPRTETQIPTWN